MHPVLHRWLVKKYHRGENSGEKATFALASGEEANNREKAREVYCPQDY